MRSKVWLILVVVAVLAVLAITKHEYAGSHAKPFDLKGDVLGESMDVFKTRHPQAQCERTSDVRWECEDKKAEFAGHLAPDDCPNCGMTARFYRDKLFGLDYWVSLYGGGNIPELLTKKFGPPIYIKSDNSDTSLVPTIARWEGPGAREVISYTAFPGFGIVEDYIQISLSAMKSPNEGDI